MLSALFAEPEKSTLRARSDGCFIRNGSARTLFGLLVAAAVFFFAASPASAIIDATLQMQLGNPSNATADTNNHDHYLIQRSVEAIDYSDHLGEPNWASWDLTAGDIGSSGRSSSFFTDTNLPPDFYWVTDADYDGVGNIDFNRGHMCPSEDRTDNTNDNRMVFFMSNIIPQAAGNNGGPWANFENYCQSLATSGDELLITCGPGIFDGTLIPSGKAAIPEYTWKIAVVVPPGDGAALSRITTNTRVISIRIPNTNGVSTTWQNFITSASQIEVDTGFTFFTALPTNIAAVLRNEVDGQSAPPPGITSFSPTNGAAGTSVVITGLNFTSASAVTFNGTGAMFNVNSSTQITAVVPAFATSGQISVTTPGGTAISSGSFTVTGTFIDLAITETHSGNFTQGGSGYNYAIIVTNVGTLPSSGTITVANTLPASLTATALSGSGWTPNLGALTCTRSDLLAAGASYPPITLTVNVASNAPASVTNMASFSGGGDTNAANNTASDPTTINPTGGGSGTNAVTLIGWDVNGLSNYGPSPFSPTTNAPNLTTVGLTRGSGVGTSGTGAARAWGGNAFTSASSAAAIAASQFVTFGLAATSGYLVSCTSVSTFDYRRSSTGPANGLLQYQIGSGPFTDIATLSYSVSASSGAALNPIDLSGIAGLQNVSTGGNITFRLVNWGGGSAGTWYIFDVADSSALDFAVQGTVAAPTPIQSWRLQWFGTVANSGAAADTAIASSDGMPNLLKYAYGLDPLVPTNDPMVADITTGYLRITLPKNPNAIDVSFQVHVTGDLTQPWTTNGTSIDQNTATLLQVHDNTAVGTAVGGRFMRLEVSDP
jgi:endonuclease G